MANIWPNLSCTAYKNVQKKCYVQSWQRPQKICSAITQKVLQQSIDRSDLFNFPLSRYFVLFHHTEVQQKGFRFVFDKIWLNSKLWFVLWDSGASPDRTTLIPLTAVRYSLFTKQMLHEPLTVKSTVALKGVKAFDLWPLGMRPHLERKSQQHHLVNLPPRNDCAHNSVIESTHLFKKGKQCHI